MKRKSSLAVAFWKFCYGNKRSCEMEQIFTMETALGKIKSGCICVKDEWVMSTSTKVMSEICKELLCSVRNAGFAVTAVGVSGDLFVVYLSDKHQLSRTDKPDRFQGHGVDYRFLGNVRILSS